MSIASGTKEITQNIASSHDERSKWLRELEKDTNQIRREARDSIADLKAEVKGMIKDFESSRVKMSSELRKELAQSNSNLKTEGAELRKELAQNSADLKAEVKGMIKGFESSRAAMGVELRADLKEASDIWQKLTPIKSGKSKIKAEPTIIEETHDLEERLLTTIKAHPEGITLSDAAESLGVVTIVLGRVSKSIIGKGKARKEDKLYFPITAGQS